jgi:ABC-2 type transport system permease protein
MSGRDAIRPYLAILTLRFREVAQYRAAAWAGVFTQVMFGFILFMSLAAFTEGNPSRSPMTREALLAYIWLGQAFLGLLPWNVDRDVVAMVKTGSVVYELARPLDIYALWFCRALGWRLSATALRCVPLLVLTGVVLPFTSLREYSLPAPPSLASASAFVLAMIVAVVLGITLTMLMQVTILWTSSVDGVQRLAPALIMLLGGVIVPLPMFPERLQTVLYALPFRGVVDLPFRTYSGDLSPRAALLGMVVSGLWAIVLVLLGRAIMARGLRRLRIHGG